MEYGPLQSSSQIDAIYYYYSARRLISQSRAWCKTSRHSNQSLV